MPGFAENALVKIVDEAEWNLSGMQDHARAQRLMRAISPGAIIDQVASEAIDPKLTGPASWRWPKGDAMVGRGRAIVVIPLAHDTLDDLFNGRCGYLAQYYRSVAEGKHFNRLLVDALCDAAKWIFDRYPKEPGWPIVERSLMGPHSKVWVYGDKSEAFVDAPEGEFAPRRWGHRSHSVFLRAPLPQRPAIDLKGTWLTDEDRSYQPDPDKADRHEMLHETGGA